jgi:hypothetical protein
MGGTPQRRSPLGMVRPGPVIAKRLPLYLPAVNKMSVAGALIMTAVAEELRSPLRKPGACASAKHDASEQATSRPAPITPRSAEPLRSPRGRTRRLRALGRQAERLNADTIWLDTADPPDTARRRRSRPADRR